MILLKIFACLTLSVFMALNAYAGYPYAMTYTPSAGNTILADHINTSNNEHINNNIPESIDDYSTNATEMQATTDPYPASSENLATTLAGELQGLRYDLLQWKLKYQAGISKWYDDIPPGGDLWTKGADVASASALPLLDDGIKNDVTGTDTITSMDGVGVGVIKLLQFNGALTLTHHSTDLILPNGVNIVTIAGDRAWFHEYASGDWELISWVGHELAHTHANVANGGTITAFPRSYLAGLNISTGSDTDHYLDIAVGECRDVANSIDVIFSSALTKQIDAVWAVGTDAGGLDTGSVGTSTTYHVFVIKRTDTGVVDALFSTSPTSPTMPTNYDKKRRIGSRYTDGSANFVAVLQNGDECLLVAPVGDYTATNPGTSAVTRTLSVPTGIVVWAKHVFLHFDSSPSGSSSALVTSLDQSDVAPSSTILTTRVAVGSGIGSTSLLIKTNTSAQIRTRLEVSDAGISISGTTSGWIDRRGRDD